MSFERASAVGASKAVGSMIETAIPSTSRPIAFRIVLTISPTSLDTEPVHSTDALISPAASYEPFFAGTKNGLVSAWFTNTNRQRGWTWGKRTPTADAAAARRSSALFIARGSRRRAADEPDCDQHDRHRERREEAGLDQLELPEAAGGLIRDRALPADADEVGVRVDPRLLCVQDCEVLASGRDRPP